MSFLFFALLLLGGWKAFGWIGSRPQKEGAPAPLRSTLTANEWIFSHLFNGHREATHFPIGKAVKDARVNGNIGTWDAVDMKSWRLQVLRPGADTLRLTLDDIKSLPKKEIVFDFKCIEGWSQVTRWAGVPLKTFLEHYGLRGAEQMNFVGLQTPDKAYYVGIDMASALHPQTLLCYELNGKPLPLDQGYPLRLIIPVKYGIKHLKRIGYLYFSNERPPDYWAERGYDYYAGH
jgi:DMSO/TMAO reductase YedYZ molybdopterin-dependent catalytic subunit